MQITLTEPVSRNFDSDLAWAGFGNFHLHE